MFLTPSLLHALAHRFIPQEFQPDPAEFFGRMAYEKQAYVDWMIEQVEASGSVDLSAGRPTVTVRCCSTGLYPAVLFIFNRPTRPTEPFMPALVATKLPRLPSIDMDEPEDAAMEPPRYFLLEATAPEEGTATRLCEWRDGTHLSHGDGPELSVKAFFEAIHRLMAA